jgi:CheY-like chemotaxis protein
MAEPEENCIPAITNAEHRVGILVVDDDMSVRTTLEMCLEQLGFQVWTAASGGEAENLYQHHEKDIALVVLDVHMPGQDGPETLARLRHINPDVQSWFMSGNLGRYCADDLYNLGAAHVFAKPFSLGGLVDALHPLVSPHERLKDGRL